MPNFLFENKEDEKLFLPTQDENSAETFQKRLYKLSHEDLAKYSSEFFCNQRSSGRLQTECIVDWMACLEKNNCDLGSRVIKTDSYGCKILTRFMWLCVDLKFIDNGEQFYK